MSWLQHKCTWKALCSWCILWGLKYILCSAPLSSRVENQKCGSANMTSDNLCGAGIYSSVLLVQCGISLSCNTPELRMLTLPDHFKFTLRSHLDKHSPLSSRTLWGHFSLSSSTTLACMQPHDGAKWTQSEGRCACFIGWRHQTPASGVRAVVSSEVNSVLVEWNSLDLNMELCPT